MKIIDRIKKIPPGAKASIAFFFSGMITSGISYLMTPVYTRMLTPEEYGQASLFLTWFQIFGIVAMFCLSYGVFNNGMSDYPEKRDEYSFSILILSNIITVAFFGIILAIFPLIASVLKINIYFALLMFILCLFQPAYNFWMMRQRYEYKYKMVLVWSIVCAILSPLVAILLMLFFPTGERLYPRLFGAECTLVVIYIGFYIFLGYKSGWKIKCKYWKQAFFFNLPLIPHYLSTYLLGSSDKIMISFLIDDSTTAYYSVAHSIATIALIIWTAMNSSLVPYTYQKCRDNKYEDINKVALPLISLFAVGCVIVILLAPEAVRIMATSDYYQVIYVIPPIVGGVFFQVQYHLYANIVFYHKKPVLVTLGSVTAVVLNIILNYFCIKKWGYIAAGYTTLLCYAVQVVIDFFALKMVVKRPVYNMKFIIILSVVVIVVSLFSNLIYDHLIVRYVLLALIFVILFIFRKKIINVFLLSKNNKTDDISLNTTSEGE